MEEDKKRKDPEEGCKKYYEHVKLKLAHARTVLASRDNYPEAEIEEAERRVSKYNANLEKKRIRDAENAKILREAASHALESTKPHGRLKRVKRADPIIVDPHPPFCIEEVPLGNGVFLDNMREIKAILASYDKWVALTGGVHGRFHIPSLNTSTDPALRRLKELIDVALEPLKKHLLTWKPGVSLFYYGCLKSLPWAQRQTLKAAQGRHCDFSYISRRLPIELQPYSVIVAVDEFELEYEQRSGKVVTKTIVFGEYARFSNATYHTGGANLRDRECYRIFMYAVADPAHLPNGGSGETSYVFPS